MAISRARLVKLWPSLVSAALYVAAFPPFNMRLAVFFCLVPWMSQLRGLSRRGALLSGYALGFLVVLEQMAWLQSLVLHWTGSMALSLLPWGLCGFLGGFYFAFAGVLIRSAFLRNRIWAIPLIWVGIEVFRSFVPGLAFPWFILAVPLWPYPAILQLAFFGTIYLVSVWVCSVNLLLERLIFGRVAREKAWLAAVTVAFPALSLVWYLRPIEGQLKTLAAGQPGFDMAFGDRSVEEEEVGRRVGTLISESKARKADLLVLPEGLVDAVEMPLQTPFEVPNDLPLLFGGKRGRDPAFQTAFAWSGRNWAFADKSRLVVFGEYVPGRDYFPFLKSFKLPAGDLKAADRVSAVDVGGLRAGPLICFEGLFWDVAHQQSENGSQFLAVMSNDDWYMGTAAPEQLWVASVWRSVETGLPVARAASLGKTAIIDQKGRLLTEAPYLGTQLVTASVHVERSPLRNPLRPVPPWLLGVFPFAFSGYLLIVRRSAARG